MEGRTRKGSFSKVQSFEITVWLASITKIIELKVVGLPTNFVFNIAF